MSGLSPLDLIIIIMAAFRLAWFVTRESGPFGIAAKLRSITTLGGLLNCWKCASFWTAALMLALWLLPSADLQSYGRGVVVWFAVSGGAILIAYYTGANHD